MTGSGYDIIDRPNLWGLDGKVSDSFTDRVGFEKIATNFHGMYPVGFSDKNCSTTAVFDGIANDKDIAEMIGPYVRKNEEVPVLSGSSEVTVRDVNSSNE